MSIKAEIICDSYALGSRITTFLLTVPKFLIYDITRHRAFSYSVASTRAIRFEKMQEAMNFTPYYFRSKSTWNAGGCRGERQKSC